MSKLDELRRTAGQNIKDSAGADRVERPEANAAGGAPDRWRGVERSRDMAMIPVAKIDRDPDQPRQEFDEEELDRLAESLRIRGQLQPIRVRWDEGRGVYVVLAGERRWRAARMAGLDKLACVIHEGVLTDEEKLAMQLVENALRADLKPVEQARAYRRLMDAQGLLDPGSGRRAAHRPDLGRPGAGAAGPPRRGPGPCRGRRAGRHGGGRADEAPRPRTPGRGRPGGRRRGADADRGDRTGPGGQGPPAGAEPAARAGDGRPGRLHRHGPLEEGVGDHGVAGAPQGSQAGSGARTPRSGRMSRGGSSPAVAPVPAPPTCGRLMLRGRGSSVPDGGS